MRLFYTDDGSPPEPERPAVFLAGPTPRSSDVKSWRPKAIGLLNHYGFVGDLYIPEWKNGPDQAPPLSFLQQVDWERQQMERASVILFWVPRDMRTLPGLTTNVEFGYYLATDPSKVRYGRPTGAESTRYLDWLYRRTTGKDPKDNLRTMVAEMMTTVMPPLRVAWS